MNHVIVASASTPVWPHDPRKDADGAARSWLGPQMAVSARRALRTLILALASVTAVVTASPAAADPPGRVGRIAESHGAVWQADDRSGEWIAATRNRPLTTGDRLSLQPGARAVIHVGSATLRVDGDSEIEMVQLDDRKVRVHLHGGSIALQLPSSDSAREFEVSTADGRVGALQRAHFRVDRRGDSSVVTAWDGPLQFESSDSSLQITRGQVAELWQDRGRTHYTWSRVDRDEFTEWVVASERRATQAVAQRYVSPEMTGGDELTRHGDWDQHPQYGAVWYPRSVSSDWAPYRDGQWAYVAPWGWTWIDNAPWGFAPFHYGRWVQWHGRWAWAPGSYVARPTYAPALVAWLGGPGLSVSISSAPHVGWVPLAPFEVYSPWFTASTLYVSHINVSPWRTVHGYQGHRYNDYANRGHRGGFTVVPQHVVTDRRPVRQDVITPQQAAVWRGGAVPPAEAMMVPGTPSRPGREGVVGGAVTAGDVGRHGGARYNDRIAGGSFVPPAPAVVAVQQSAPALPPGAHRAVPWVRHMPGVSGGGVVGAIPGVVSAPAVTTRDGVPMSSPPVGAQAPRGEGSPMWRDGSEPRRLEPPVAGDRRNDDKWNANDGRARGVKQPLESSVPVMNGVPQGLPAPQAVPSRPSPPMANPGEGMFEPQRPSRAFPGGRERDMRERDMPVMVAPPAQAQRPIQQPMPQVIQAPVSPPSQVMAPRPAAQPMPQMQPPAPPPAQAQPPRQRGSNNDDDERGPRRGNNDQRVR